MSEGPPAGWYPDPTRRNEHRYWDGRAWTAIAGRDGHQVVDPMPPGLPSDQRAELAYARTYLEVRRRAG